MLSDTVNNELALPGASDAALVIAIGRWRQDALEEAYRRHAGSVFALARRVLVDRALAEEVVQEVFIRLWYEADRFDPARGSLRSFLLTQTHGRSVDMLRSETARRLREEREARDAPVVVEDAEASLDARDLSGRVRDALKKLPKTQRTAIEMAYFGGKSYKEVAVLLEEPEGTVKSRIRSGLGRLRLDLEASGGVA